MNRVRNSKPSWKVILAITITVVCVGLLVYDGITRPRPPKIEDLPPLDVEFEPSFIDSNWESANIQTICIDGKIDWPKDQYSPPSFSSLSDTLGYLGYDTVIEEGTDCDAYLNLQVMGKPLSAKYSWSSRNCLSGFEFEAQFSMTANGLSDFLFTDAQKQSPPETILESACDTAFESGLNDAWNSFLNATISSVWGKEALINIEWNNPSPFRMDICMQGLTQAKEEYLNFYIQKMMESEEYPNSTCISSLQNLGPDAELAVPYLLYLLDTINTEHGDYDKELIFETLRTITGEDIADHSRQWWAWWEDQH